MKVIREFEAAKISGIWKVYENYYEDDGMLATKKFEIGPWLFTFDKKKIFNFWPDYPNKLTKDQVEIFKKAFPEMAKLRG